MEVYITRLTAGHRESPPPGHREEGASPTWRSRSLPRQPFGHPRKDEMDGHREEGTSPTWRSGTRQEPTGDCHACSRRLAKTIREVIAKPPIHTSVIANEWNECGDLGGRVSIKKEGFLAPL